MDRVPVIGRFSDGRPIFAMAGGDPSATAYEFPELDTIRGADALREDRSHAVARMRQLDAQYDGQVMPDEARSEFAALREREAESGRRIEELDARSDYMLRVASEGDGEQPGVAERAGQPIRRTGANASAGTRLPDDIYELWSYRGYARNEDHYGELLSDGARRAVERAVYPHPSADADAIRGDLERLLLTVDDPNQLARHILGTGSPAYGQAFGRALQSMDDSEVRAMSLGTNAAGGFAVPFQLDPTVILTSDGVINPLRTLSRVERVTGKQWQGVTSAGITVSRSAEADEATDDSPTLAQPTVDTHRVTGFVPFSVEIDSSWSALQAEMARMLQDAKDTEEATAFIDGDGTGNNPNGLVATLDSGSIVFTGDASFGVEDVYAVKNALPARWRPRATFLAESAIYDVVRQFDTAGGSALWVQLEADRPGQLIGYRAEEMSTMDATVADANQILLIGDFQQFLIVDRIGMTIELIPHLFGTNHRPTGQRGIYAYWHNGSEILVDGAFRLLEVGAS